MKVPLIVNSFVDGIQQKLEIWYNSKRVIIDPPIMPYVISKTPLSIAESTVKVEQTSGYPLSTLREVPMYKYIFPNTGMISSLNRSLDKAGRDVAMLVSDNHTEFRERILIDLPHWFDQYANDQPLKVLCFDIETLTLERHDYGSIMSIAWGTDLEHIESKQAQVFWKPKQDNTTTINTMLYPFNTVDDLVADLQTKNPQITNEETLEAIDVFAKSRTPFVLQEDEAELIQAFYEAIKRIDPDIIIGYYHKGFDFPRLFERSQLLNIPYTTIARDGVVQYSKRKYGGEEKITLVIGGRVIYDINDSVRSDQSLHGIKRKKLKNVVEWMKLPVLREDTKNTAFLTQAKLKRYNEHDVFSTIQLFNVYFRNQQALCEMFGIPLNMLLDSSASFLGNIFHAPALHALHIVSDGMNRERHNDIYERTLNKEAGEQVDDDEDRAAYEAAYVDIYQTGRFEKIRKVDYKGMYNAIEITANISPETTKIVNFLPYKEDGFSYEKRGSFTLYHVPDRRIFRTVVIAVNNQFDGILRKELKRIRETRFKIKQQMKTCEPDEIPRLESQQYGLKVVANIPSGYNGQGVARWGDIAVSILTVGIGRLLIQDTVRYIESKYGGNDWIYDIKNLKNMTAEQRAKIKICVEIDTDGIYVCEDIDVEELNVYLERRVKELLGVEQNEMQLEFEEFGAGVFIKMKNYLLYDTKGNLEIHGAGLKGSRQPNCFDIALEKLAACLLTGKGVIRDVINDVLDISQYKLDDLALGVTLGKSPDEYGAGTMIGKLVRQAAILGEEVNIGSEFDYVKATDGYRLAHTIQSKHEIDYNYYVNMLSNLVVNLGLREELTTRNIDSIDDWLTAQPEMMPVIDPKNVKIDCKQIDVHNEKQVDEKPVIVSSKQKLSDDIDDWM